jgi:superfamily I DNA/RNA helicase
MPSTLTPTPEQQKAIDLFADGGSLVVQAGAGSGKTTTLGMAARARNASGTYVAFNKAIVNDAGAAMPMGVEARTLHSLAYRAVQQHHRFGRRILADTRAPRIAPWAAAKILGLNHETVVVEVPQSDGSRRRKVIQPTQLASHVMRAVAVFCNSADTEPGIQHFPYMEGIDRRLDDGRRGRSNNRQLATMLVPWLRKAWADLVSEDSQLRSRTNVHDLYVKLWHLGRYGVPGEFVLFDEAQDASPVMLDALFHAAKTGQQVCYVGDSSQQIYEWRGAIDALDQVDGSFPRTSLTQSWRFGQEVADVANLLLDRLDAPLRLQGNPSLDTRVHTTPASAPRPDAVLCRTNAAAVEALLQYQALGLNPHMVGGTDDIVYFATAAAKLQAGEKVGHPDLACFETWREVQAYVEDDPAGSDLRTMVRLLDGYGTQIVMDALTGLVAEREADVVVSTAHKAKGREWPRVRLAGDFPDEEGQDPSPPELRLMYVAATRAREHLDVSACGAVRKIMAGVDR